MRTMQVITPLISDNTGPVIMNYIGGSPGYVTTPALALAAWKKSKSHNAIILNLDNWTSIEWSAVGAAAAEEHAVLRLGEEQDPCSPP